MSSPGKPATPGEPPATGLRARKKAKTRAAIQHAALRMFREQGYHATTVEQIAEAVEVSTTTFYRYFPTKEDVVLTDEYDPLIIEAYRAQPAGLSPIQAWRGAMRSVFGGISTTELADFRQRYELTMAVPELRASALDQLAQTMRVMDAMVATRAGRDPGDFELYTFTGALCGVYIAVLLNWVEHPDVDLFDTMDRALAHLEAGLPL